MLYTPPYPVPHLTIVAAVAEGHWTIGANGGIPWNIPEDMKRVKDLTMGKCVIMGRCTYESIGKPLHGRHTIVLTKTKRPRGPNLDFATNLTSAINKARKHGTRDGEIIIFGGTEVYREALPLVHFIHLTEVYLDLDEYLLGDTLFPRTPSTDWNELYREDHPKNGKIPAYRYSIFRNNELPLEWQGDKNYKVGNWV